VRSDNLEKAERYRSDDARQSEGAVWEAQEAHSGECALRHIENVRARAVLKEVCRRLIVSLEKEDDGPCGT
jgi:hypothetical protein